jgi:anti-sigma B factor antagonist
MKSTRESCADDEPPALRDLVLEVQQHGISATLRMQGELDAFTAPELADLCGSVFADGGRDIVIDLTDTSFLDSSGLRTLIGARQLFGSEGGTVRLAHPNESVIRLLALTGLSDYFSIDEEPLV